MISQDPTYVLAFKNRDEYNFVAENHADLSDRLDLNGGELEIGTDQCDNCGSFAPDGEPGRGFIVKDSAPAKAVCGECGWTRPIVWHAANDTVFTTF
jgi:hypothetical protein